MGIKDCCALIAGWVAYGYGSDAVAPVNLTVIARSINSDVAIFCYLNCIINGHRSIINPSNIYRDRARGAAAIVVYGGVAKCFLGTASFGQAFKMIYGGIGNLIAAAIHLGNALICGWVYYGTNPHLVALVWVFVVDCGVKADRLVFCNCNGVVYHHWLVVFAADRYVHLGGGGGTGLVCNGVGKCFAGGLPPGDGVKFAGGGVGEGFAIGTDANYAGIALLAGYPNDVD